MAKKSIQIPRSTLRDVLKQLEQLKRDAASMEAKIRRLIRRIEESDPNMPGGPGQGSGSPSKKGGGNVKGPGKGKP